MLLAAGRQAGPWRARGRPGCTGAQGPPAWPRGAPRRLRAVSTPAAAGTSSLRAPCPPRVPRETSLLRSSSCFCCDSVSVQPSRKPLTGGVGGLRASGPHWGPCFVAPVPSGSSDSPSLHWLCVRSQPSSGIPGSHGEGSVTPRASLPAPDRCPRTSTRHRARMSRGVLRSGPARLPFLPARSSPGAVRSAPASAVRPVGPLGAGGLHTSSPTFPPARLNASAPASPGPPLSPASVGS